MRNVTVLGGLLVAMSACGAPPAGWCDDHGRQASPEEWTAAMKRAKVHADHCPPAYLMLVDDVQAEEYGMKERGEPNWFAGYTYACGKGATVAMLRVDAVQNNPDIITHELMHAAILCSTEGNWGDADHTLPGIWEGDVAVP